MAKKEVKKVTNAKKKEFKSKDSKIVTGVVVPENILFKLLS